MNGFFPSEFYIHLVNNRVQKECRTTMCFFWNDLTGQLTLGIQLTNAVNPSKR